LPAVENRVLAYLPLRVRAQLLKRCESVELRMNEALAPPGEDMRYVYFPTAGFISIVTLMGGKPMIEVAMVGSEGMYGAHLVLGQAAPEAFHPIVQGGGRAWRISTDAFAREMVRTPALQQAVHLYLQISISQLANAATCLRFHPLESRLARWLLMTQDRAHSDTFQVTQEFLGFMLGVRRSGVTVSAAALQRSGLIRYRRGIMTIVKRRGMLSKACACYAADRKIYRAILP
jgi:CRP-like cAMP-binding protein